MAIMNLLWWLYIYSNCDHFQKTIGILSKVLSTYGPNWVILARIGDALSYDKLQARNWAKSYFEVKSNLEGQDRSPPKTIGIQSFAPLFKI